MHENEHPADVEPGELGHIDIHADLPRETIGEIRNGKKTVTIQDRETGDRVSVGRRTITVSWPLILAFLGLVGTMVGGVVKTAFEAAKVQTAAQEITGMKQDISTALSVLSQHGNEFSSMRKDMSTMMELYNRLDTRIQSLAVYSADQAQRDWQSHDRYIQAEHRALMNQIEALQQRINDHHPPGGRP